MKICIGFQDKRPTPNPMATAVARAIAMGGRSMVGRSMLACRAPSLRLGCPRLGRSMAVGLRVLIAALLALELPMADATLGGDSASIENDRAAMRVAQAARQTMSASGRYSVHESVLPNGVLVRQYVSAGDKVFAVSWSGPYLPDLRQLLGAHFDTMTERKTKQPRLGHSTVSQHEADLVIESGGHPHSFAGRAYLPQALPAGVDVQEIR